MFGRGVTLSDLHFNGMVPNALLRTMKGTKDVKQSRKSLGKPPRIDNSGLDQSCSRKASESCLALRNILRVGTKLLLDVNLCYYFYIILNTLTMHLFTLPY